jgi:outer membrane protein
MSFHKPIENWVVDIAEICSTLFGDTVMRTKTFLRNGLFFALISSTAALAQDTDTIKIGVVNLERAINEVDEGAKAKADLKKEFDQKQATLDMKQNEVKAMAEAAEKQSGVMKPEAKQAKMMEVQRKAAEVQQIYMGMQQDMMKRQNEVMGAILQKMNTVASTIGTEGGYTAILNKTETSVLYAKPSLDLTNELIRRYNEAYGKAGKAPAKSKK